MMFFECCLILGSLPWKNRFKKIEERIASHVYVFRFLVNFGWRFLCSRLAPCVLAGQQGENRTTLVFFLGGVTYAEIAALRFLSQMEDSGMEYIIATTKLMNGTTWIKSLMDRPESQNQWDTCVYTWLHQTTHPLWLEKKKTHLLVLCPSVNCRCLIDVCAAWQSKRHFFFCLLSALLAKYFLRTHISLNFISSLKKNSTLHCYLYF